MTARHRAAGDARVTACCSRSCCWLEAGARTLSDPEVLQDLAAIEARRTARARRARGHPTEHSAPEVSA